MIECNDCNLRLSRTNIVEGVGNQESSIIFIGEAPGRNEDTQGKPFVGRAGKILDELLAQIKLSRDDIYITNVIKCRPPRNRNPTTEEVDTCSKYLDKELEDISPKIIVTLGRFATEYIFNKYGLLFTSIGKSHGNIINVNGVTLIPMYHPASVIYDKSKELCLYNDFMCLSKILEER
jgi:DNA polymerase